MNTLFNEHPKIAYFFDMEEHQEDIEKGYASQVESSGNKTVLVFKDVDDHIDGNGLSMLWLIQGQGRFYHDGEAIDMKTGDVLVFDDNIEHGFESSSLCVAVNVLLEKNYNLNEIKSMVKSLNSPSKKTKPNI